MRYMMLVYTTEESAAHRTPADMETTARMHGELMAEARSLGILVSAEPLATTATATTVRVKNGTPLITDGPFAETKEQLAGYYILDCKDLDEAIQWAARMPTNCAGLEGCIEIRPLRFQPESAV